MTWQNEIKKRKMFVSNKLPEGTKTFLKELEEALDEIVPSVKEDIKDYPEYNRERIIKVIMSTLQQEIDLIKINIKTSQVELKPPPENKRRD